MGELRIEISQLDLSIYHHLISGEETHHCLCLLPYQAATESSDFAWYTAKDVILSKPNIQKEIGQVPTTVYLVRLGKRPPTYS